MTSPLCSRSYSRCCQKLRNGAIPVPGPTSMQGVWLFLGSWKDGALQQKNSKKLISKMSAMWDDHTLVLSVQHGKKSPTDIYLRTKHGTISPFSILLSHDEHTPWWIDPAPSKKDDYQASTLFVSLHSHSLTVQIISAQKRPRRRISEQRSNSLTLILKGNGYTSASVYNRTYVRMHNRCVRWA